MKLLKVKTGRFSEIVEKAGRPESYTLWQKPSADRHLQSAIKNNRIMTIQRTESGTEFGIVGFKQTKDARYLVFPKSLKRFENRRVVGINWDLVTPVATTLCTGILAVRQAELTASSARSATPLDARLNLARYRN